MTNFLRCRSIVGHEYLINVTEISMIEQKPDHLVRDENNEVIISLKSGETRHVVGLIGEIGRRLREIDGICIISAEEGESDESE